MTTNKIFLNPMPSIDGLSFRKFARESDFPIMVNIVAKTAEADKENFAVTLESLKHDYQHLTNSDPDKDMIFAEIDGNPVAYSRVQWWQEEDPNDRIYFHFVKILPRWRHQGIEEAIIGWCENRLQQIAKDHPLDSQRFFQTDSNDHNEGFAEIIKSLGYEPKRFSIGMSRPLEDIPEADLPEVLKFDLSTQKTSAEFGMPPSKPFAIIGAFQYPKRRTSFPIKDPSTSSLTYGRSLGRKIKWLEAC